MHKKKYQKISTDLNILTQVNPTYNSNEIPTVITTTAGIFMQSGNSSKISDSKPKSKKVTINK
jgi:hypothetical protein